jgi:hypothetical protein
MKLREGWINTCYFIKTIKVTFNLEYFTYKTIVFQIFGIGVKCVLLL